MDLNDIATQGKIKPPRIVIYGTHKIGKSTFASQAPSPIFIQTEDGLDNLPVEAFPLATSYAAILDALKALYNESHKYKTVVLDSLDWLEKLIWEATCRADGKHGIEDFGYGKGYVAALDVWREFLKELNALRLDKGMSVILIAHAEIKKFDSPDTEPYDRFQPKLHGRATALISEWSDIIGFANYKTIVKITGEKFNETKHRGISTGERLLYLEERPAFLAGNRYGLPASIAFDWESLKLAFNKEK